MYLDNTEQTLVLIFVKLRNMNVTLTFLTNVSLVNYQFIFKKEKKWLTNKMCFQDYQFDCVKLHVCTLGRSSTDKNSTATTLGDTGVGLISLLQAKCPSIIPESSMGPSCQAFGIGVQSKTSTDCKNRFIACNLDSNLLAYEKPSLGFN